MQTLSPNLMVKDVTASINFYHDILGLEILMKIPEDNKPIWALLQKNNITIMLQQKESLIEEYPIFLKELLEVPYLYSSKLIN